MALTRTGRRFVAGGAFLVAFHTLLAYGLPAGVVLALALALGLLYYRIGAYGAVTVSVSLVVVTATYALMLKLTGFENAIYYRPHEILATYDYTHDHRVYRRTASVEMRMPHGDIQPLTNEDIGVPRQVAFRTDADGFRNDRDYHGQRYLLLGDSFVVGIADTQADILSAQLARDYRIDTYNLGHPGDPVDYAIRLDGFRARHPGSQRVLLFLFEGNDFPDSLTDVSDKRASAAGLLVRRYYDMFSETAVFRVTKSLYKRATRLGAIASAENVEVVTINRERLAFYGPYVSASRQPAYQAPPALDRTIAAMAPDLEHVFFIPTKYRVYQRFVRPTEVLPNARWEYLSAVCARHGLRCTDLSGPLAEASRELLRGGRLTWWPDDTHWNANGMAVAAREVARVLAARADR